MGVRTHVGIEGLEAASATPLAKPSSWVMCGRVWGCSA